MPDAPACPPPLHLVVMGVAGCGKSVVAAQVAQRLDLPLVEGDDFHPASDIERMRAGERLTAQDRGAWLRRLAQELGAHPQGAVLSCSALRQSDRELLRAGVQSLHFLHLALTAHQALERVAARTDHFYPPSLVAGDFEALEDPAREPLVHVADATLHVDRIVDAALRWLQAARPLAFTDAGGAPVPRIAAMTKAFASQADLADKKITFEQLSPHCWAYTAEGDPNSGVIIGERFIMVSDATATPAMARDLIARIRTVSDKPIKYVLLTHYHAVRVLGASAYFAEGATEIIASQGTHELIVERGKEDMQSEMDRFPRLFRNAESVPGLTWPTLVIGGGDPTRGEPPGRLTLDLGGVKVQVWSPGWGHTRGDTIAWIEAEKVLFSGDLVEYNAGVYTGDAHLQEWPATLEALRALGAEALVPGRGEALQGAEAVNRGLDYTKRWVETLFACAKEAAAANMDLKAAMAHTRKAMDPVFGNVFIYEHCLPFDVSRAYDEARGVKNPRVWTAERDKEMWASLQG